MNTENVRTIFDKEIIVEKRNYVENDVEEIGANVKITESFEAVGEKMEDGKLLSFDVTITIDTQMFTLLKAHFDEEAFNKIRDENELAIEFEDFPEEIKNLLISSQKQRIQSKPKPNKKPKSKKTSRLFIIPDEQEEEEEEVENHIYFIVNSDSSELHFFDVLEFKEVEIFSISFQQADEEESNLQAQNAFKKVKDELLLQTRRVKFLEEEIKKQCPFVLDYIKKKQ